jgi:hypothetical protein
VHIYSSRRSLLSDLRAKLYFTARQHLPSSEPRPFGSHIDSEDAEIQKSIHSLETEGQELEAEVEQAQSVLIALFNERQRIKEHENYYRSLLAPALRLPTEILSQIFLHCVGNEPRSPHPDVPPLLLTRICSRWRKIALSTPHLWAKVAIVLHTKVDPSHAQGIRDWISRSGFAPLNLRLKVTDSQRRMRAVCLFNDILMKEGSRCTCIALSLKGENASFLQVPEGHLSRLLELQLDSQEEEPSGWKIVWDALGNDPQLRRLKLVHSDSKKVHKPGPTAPLQRLTSLRTACYGTQSLIDILQLCPNIEELDCHFADWDFEIDLDDEFRVTLPKLRYVNCQGQIGLFSYLIAPQLKEVAIRTFDVELKDWKPCFLSFLTRSACFIEKFVYDAPSVEFLQHMPNLVELQLLNTNYMVNCHDLIEKLTIPHGVGSTSKPTVFLPKLRRLDLRKFMLSPELLLSMIESRWTAECTNEADGPHRYRFESVSVDVLSRLDDKPISAKVFARFDRLKSEGLQGSLRQIY